MAGSECRIPAILTATQPPITDAKKAPQTLKTNVQRLRFLTSTTRCSGPTRYAPKAVPIRPNSNTMLKAARAPIHTSVQLTWQCAHRSCWASASFSCRASARPFWFLGSVPIVFIFVLPSSGGTARRKTVANRRRIRGPRGKRLLRRRGEYRERSFAHAYETGGMRRLHLRGRENILKRLLVHV